MSEMSIEELREDNERMRLKLLARDREVKRLVETVERRGEEIKGLKAELKDYADDPYFNV